MPGTKLLPDFQAQLARLEKTIDEIAAFDMYMAPENAWCIAEVLEHIGIANNTYIPKLTLASSVAYRPALILRLNPFCDVFGKMLIKAMDPANRERRKIKTFDVFEPKEMDRSFDEIRTDVALSFETLAVLVNKLHEHGLENRISSPVNDLICLRASHALEILDHHTERHILQILELVEYQKNL